MKNLNSFNPPKNLGQVPENQKNQVYSSFDIYKTFESKNYRYLKISFDGGYSYTQIKDFSTFCEYLNFYQSKQPDKKIFFLNEGKNSFLALLESNKYFEVTI